MNVTLGIPRLREIIMTASKTISTPTMILPLKLEHNTEKNAKELLKEFQKVLLSDLVNEVRVEETLVRVSFIVNRYAKNSRNTNNTFENMK